MGEVPGAAAVLGAAVLAEGGRRAGGGVGEAVGEALVGDAGEAVVGVVGVVGESGVGTRGGGVAHRGRLLESDIDTASRGVFDGLFGLVVEAIVLQAVAGRSQGGEMGAGARATHPSDRRTWPRSTRRTMEGGIAWMWRNGEGSACVCVRLRASAERFCGPSKERVFGKGTCSLSDTEGKAKVFAFVSMGADTKANTLGAGGAPTQRGAASRLLEDLARERSCPSRSEVRCLADCEHGSIGR